MATVDYIKHISVVDP